MSETTNRYGLGRRQHRLLDSYAMRYLDGAITLDAIEVEVRDSGPQAGSAQRIDLAQKMRRAVALRAADLREKWGNETPAEWEARQARNREEKERRAAEVARRLGASGARADADEGLSAEEDTAWLERLGRDRTALDAEDARADAEMDRRKDED